MRILLFLLIASIIIVSAAAEPFVPEPLEVSVQYSDWMAINSEKVLSLPVTNLDRTVTAFLTLSSKGNGEKIGDMWHVSFLGWRYTGGIDTCVAVSSPQVFETGICSCHV